MMASASPPSSLGMAEPEVDCLCRCCGGVGGLLEARCALPVLLPALVSCGWWLVDGLTLEASTPCGGDWLCGCCKGEAGCA